MWVSCEILCQFLVNSYLRFPFRFLCDPRRGLELKIEASREFCRDILVKPNLNCPRISEWIFFCLVNSPVKSTMNSMWISREVRCEFLSNSRELRCGICSEFPMICVVTFFWFALEPHCELLVNWAMNSAVNFLWISCVNFSWISGEFPVKFLWILCEVFAVNFLWISCEFLVWISCEFRCEFRCEFPRRRIPRTLWMSPWISRISCEFRMIFRRNAPCEFPVDF